MTLVAIEEDEAAGYFMISDIVTSTNQKSSPIFPLRSSREDFLSLYPDKYATGVCQKSFIISEKLLVSFCGDGWEGLKFVDRLKACNDFKSAEDLIIYFNEYFKEYITENSFRVAGMIVLGNKIGRFAWPPNPDHNKYVIGSGREHFLSHISNFVDNKINDPEKPYLAGPVSKLGTLIGIHFESDESLKNLYGGFFELTLFDGKKFFKFDDYIIVIMNVEIKNRKINLLPPSAFIKPF